MDRFFLGSGSVINSRIVSKTILNCASYFREAFKAPRGRLDTNDGVCCCNPVLASQEFVQALDIF